MIPRVLLFLWIAAALLAGFLWAPLVPGLEDTTRVLYFHIPCAWIAALALGWSALHSAGYLRTRRMEHDDQAAAAAELGILFCIGATVSGSLWARARWGSYWNWDPRETTIFFLLLIYGAYLALRGAVDGAEKRARLAAIYSVTAFVTVPFLVFVAPRLYDTLHPSPMLPQDGGPGGMDARIWISFLGMLVGFTALFFWILSLEVRFLRLARRITAGSASAPTAAKTPAGAGPGPRSVDPER